MTLKPETLELIIQTAIKRGFKTWCCCHQGFICGAEFMAEKCEKLEAEKEASYLAIADTHQKLLAALDERDALKSRLSNITKKWESVCDEILKLRPLQRQLQESERVRGIYRETLKHCWVRIFYTDPLHDKIGEALAAGEGK